MARKAFKPNKAVAKRFRVTKTGKLKRNHGFTSHLMSGRNAKTRRNFRQPAIVPESHARRLRKLMGMGHLGPGKTATARAARAAASKAAREAAGEAAGAKVEAKA